MFFLLIFLLFGVQTLCGFEYLGCYKSSKSDPELSVLSSKDFGSISGCIEECRSLYYMFAGLMEGQKCYCDSSYGRNGLSENCTIPCFNNASSMCGSFNAMSIYSTGQKGPSPPRRIEAIHEGTNSLLVSWQPPDKPNGFLTSYIVRAVATETHALKPLPPVGIQVEGGSSKSIVLSGLQSGTKYKISVTAKNDKGTSHPAFATAWTLIGPPNKPETPILLRVMYTRVSIILKEGSSENGPITSYQVVVVQPGAIPPTGPNIAYPNYDQSRKDNLGYYVTAEFDAFDFPNYKLFVVGNRKNIGGYYNAPLENSVVPQMGLVVVSRNRDSVQYKYSDLSRNFSEALAQANYMMTLWAACVSPIILILTVAFVYYMIKCSRQPDRRPVQRQHNVRHSLEYLGRDEGYEMADRTRDRTRDRNIELQKKKIALTIPRDLINFQEESFRRGRYGFIYRGSVQQEKSHIPVTVQRISKKSLKKVLKKKMEEELDISIQAESMRYLLRLVGICKEKNSLLVVMEMAPETLKQRLLDSRPENTFPTEYFLRIASVIAQALQYLQERQCVHTRLCARSIGIYPNFSPKLMVPGIGLDTLEDIRYTRWTAVECYEKSITRQTSVVWAFGVLLWEMLSLGGTPYANFSMECDVEEFVKRGRRLRRLENATDPVYETMMSCWNSNEQRRPTFAELTRLGYLGPIRTTVSAEYNSTLELNSE